MTGRRACERFDEGDAWVIEGVDRPDQLRHERRAPASRRGDPRLGALRGLRHGGYDPAARLVEMDRDGVDAEVLYPTPRLLAGDPRQPRRRAPPGAACARTTTGCRSTPPRARVGFGGLAHAPELRGRAGRSPRSTACSPARACAARSSAATRTARWSHARGRQGLGARSVDAGVPLQHPREPDASRCRAAHRAKLPGYGRFFDAPEPHRRADLRRRLRPLPRARSSCSPRSTAAGCRTSRSRSTTTTSGSSRSAASVSQAPPSDYIERHFHFCLHHRHVRRPQPPRRRRRADPVVERLPAHQRRLAELVAHDPGVDVGSAECRARADPGRQRRPPVRLRHLTTPRRSGREHRVVCVVGLDDLPRELPLPSCLRNSKSYLPSWLPRCEPVGVVACGDEDVLRRCVSPWPRPRR